jgi:hypothetical protein
MTPVTIILLAVIVAVVFIDLYLKRKNKLATTKDIEKVIDKEHPEKKEYNKPIAIATATLLLLIASFFIVNHQLYDGKLTDTDDGISLIQNITFDKINIKNLNCNQMLIFTDSIWFDKSTMQPATYRCACVAEEAVTDFVDIHSRTIFQVEKITEEVGYVEEVVEEVVVEEALCTMTGFIINGLKNGLWREKITIPCFCYGGGFCTNCLFYTDRVCLTNSCGSEFVECSAHKSGDWRETYITEGNYKQGKKEGVHKELLENEQLVFEGAYKDGKKEGVHKKWHENGQLWTECTFKNGEAYGLSKRWDENGQLIER